MKPSPQPTTPAGETLLESKEPAPQPIMLWQALEQEIREIHGSAVDLGPEYEAERAEAERRARGQVERAIRERLERAGESVTRARLQEEVANEILRQPELINGPCCQVLYQRIHAWVEARPEHAAQHSALCLSGGGIRSATFALGLLQGLAENGVLPDVAYLSTVSGGGYIGAWLSSWIKHSDPWTVFKSLGTPERPADDSGRQATAAAATEEPIHPFATEPREILHLRKYSNYLTPVLGLLSGDGWAVVAIVVRNLLLNWLLIIPGLLFVMLVPRVALRMELHEMGRDHRLIVAATAAAFVCGVVALVNLLTRRGKSQKLVLVYSIVPLVGFSACATLAWFWSRSLDPVPREFALNLPHFAFYTGWGAMTVLIAAPIAAVIRAGADIGGRIGPLWALQPWGCVCDAAREFYHAHTRICSKWKIARDWTYRMICLLAVFSLTGLSACWMGEKAVACLENVQRLERAARALPPGAPPPSAGWALVSRVENGTQVSEWIPATPAQADRTPLSSLLLPQPAVTPGEQRVRAAAYSVCFGFPLLLSLIFVASTVLTGLLSRQMLDADREWLARASGWAFLLAVIFCFGNMLVLWGPGWILAFIAAWPKLLALLVGGSGWLTIGGGKSGRMAARDDQQEKPDTKERILSLLVKLAAPLFVVLLIILFSLLTSWFLRKLIFEDDEAWSPSLVLERAGLVDLAIFAVVFAFMAAVSSLCVNINKFSLHAMYRNRLIRAYLGATNKFRAPNPFTGFDPKDNFPICELRGQRPFHVVNTALNLVGGNKLAWQQRLAMSFTITPLTAGSGALGYRDAAQYAVGPRMGGITLGTALAISGAAVSPNHGYNSSPLIAFLLTFFNARLGAWLANPGAAGEKTWHYNSPRVAMLPLVYEALGLTDSDHPYVYLSDGGHFENLGLYEMIMRRCRTIIVSDAGCDPEFGFDDLGNAISKIRVDLGIRIVFQPNIGIRKITATELEEGQRKGVHCAIATIYYSDVDGPAAPGKCREGTLIYFKPSMCGEEPMDVYHYFREHAEFPHEPTTDQWFSESQFESYRTLGYHSVEQVAGEESTANLRAFVDRAREYVRGGKAPRREHGRPVPPPQSGRMSSWRSFSAVMTGRRQTKSSQ